MDGVQATMSQDILQILQNKPEDIFKLKENNGNYFNVLAKSFLDPLTKEYSVLDEIYIDGLDSTQVFGQTKMVLDGVGEKLLGEKIPSIRERLERDEEEEEDDEEEDDEVEVEEEVEEEDDDDKQEILDEESEEEQQDEEEEEEEAEEEEGADSDEFDQETLTESEYNKDTFGLNDGFFDIDQFNKQILSMEKDDNQEDEDEEEIDYFASLSDAEDDDEEEEVMDYYDDFYDKPGKFNPKVAKKKSKDEGDDDEEEFDGDLNEDDYDNAVGSAMLDLFADEEEKPEPEENLSSFEKQQRAIQAEIAKLEAELIADKKWTMKGEITSSQRPKESLLDETDLSFDRTAKPVPVITEESTQTLEDLIRKRIKEDEFNDLPRRMITDISKFHKPLKAEVSEQKSSKSLAELYEDEYNEIDAQQENINDEIKKQHDEISELFTNVTHKLDALCSAHFIPKPHQSKTIEIKVTDSSSPAISMEDAQPLHVSSESRLAPQEIYKIGDDAVKGDGVKGKSQVQLKSGLSYAKDELSREDKQRLRRATKRKKAKEYSTRQEAKRQKNLQGEKKVKNNDVVDTLSSARNITVIGHKGEMRDIKGNLKKSNQPQSTNRFKL